MTNPYADLLGLQKEQSSQGCDCTEGPGRTDSEDEFASMVGDDHLVEARKALDDGYSPDPNPLKTVWGRVSDARRHLDAIGPESRVYGAARSLRREILSRDKQMEHLRVALTNQIMVRQREMLANELERLYIDRGIFIEVELSGPEKASIRFGCPLFQEVAVERIADESSLFVCLRKAGFKKVVFGDNEENTWTYSLQGP